MGDKREETKTRTLADAIRTKESRVLEQLASAPIIPVNANLVSRPWGGRWLCTYKGIATTSENHRWGEAFELSAFDADDETSAHPSIIRLNDGSEMSLSELLTAAGPMILGEDFAHTHGCQLPLLPKTLDVGELLSVQAHPEGLTEAYIVIEAEENATIRLGFKEDVAPEKFHQRLKSGRQLQNDLLESLQDVVGVDALQAAVKDNFAQRDQPAEAVLSGLPLSQPSPADRGLADNLRRLKEIYWEVLDLLNEVEVRPGMVIHNANPVAISEASGRQRSAEIHALGNPEGREMLVLELRQPGPTFRAWDNVRFPIRPVDVDVTLRAVNPKATRPEDFIVSPEPLDSHPGVTRSVEDDAFTIHHLHPRPWIDVRPPVVGQWHTLHCIQGDVGIEIDDNSATTPLRRGQSALIPVAMESYKLTANCDNAEVIFVTVS